MAFLENLNCRNGSQLNHLTQLFFAVIFLTHKKSFSLKWVFSSSSLTVWVPRVNINNSSSQSPYQITGFLWKYELWQKYLTHIMCLSWDINSFAHILSLPIIKILFLLLLSPFEKRRDSLASSLLELWQQQKSPAYAAKETLVSIHVLFS